MTDDGPLGWLYRNTLKVCRELPQLIPGRIRGLKEMAAALEPDLNPKAAKELRLVVMRLTRELGL